MTNHEFVLEKIFLGWEFPVHAEESLLFFVHGLESERKQLRVTTFLLGKRVHRRRHRPCSSGGDSSWLCVVWEVPGGFDRRGLLPDYARVFLTLFVRESIDAARVSVWMEPSRKRTKSSDVL